MLQHSCGIRRNNVVLVCEKGKREISCVCRNLFVIFLHNSVKEKLYSQERNRWPRAYLANNDLLNLDLLCYIFFS
jgi:hypothetical protein